MLRTRNDQPTLWESILPPEVLRLPAELARVDALLDDERFFAPFWAYFDLTFGQPSIRVETYLRLMFLKVRYWLGQTRFVGRGNAGVSILARGVGSRVHGVHRPQRVGFGPCSRRRCERFGGRDERRYQALRSGE
jgi:hypothetical protein